MDLIKRQDAMDVHCSICPDKGKCPDREIDVCPDRELFRMIKPVRPEQPKAGRWLPIHGEPIVACSVCRKKYDWDTEAQYYNFCPMCGAKMEG